MGLAVGPVGPELESLVADRDAGPVVRELEPQLAEVARVAVGPETLRRTVDRYVWAATST